mmetsp:Transcript_30654/g.47029  ORF Transcript_30654/g.47029 Transcript_30654/m.47029 type:complete len:81 (+) Transcript_30654:279-521(+)
MEDLIAFVKQEDKKFPFSLGPNKEWEEQQRFFHECQAILKSKHRIQHKRMQPVDHLAFPALVYFSRMGIPSSFVTSPAQF